MLSSLLGNQRVRYDRETARRASGVDGATLNRPSPQRVASRYGGVTAVKPLDLTVPAGALVMRVNKVAQMGTPRELYEAPDNVFVATFKGEANHVKGTLEAATPEHGMVRLDTLALALPRRGLPCGPVDVVIRPETVSLVDPHTEGCPTATVRTATYMGAHAEYNLDTPVGPLFVIAPEATTLRPPSATVGVMLAERGVFAVKP